MGRPTRSGSALRQAENQHVEYILSIARNSTHGAFCLGVTLRSLYIRLARKEISSFTPKNPVKHPLSTPDLSLREFRALVIQDAIRNTSSISEASRILGTSVKTVYVYMGGVQSAPVRRKIGQVATDLPVSFADQKPDVPIRNNQRTLDNMEVSVWVDPEERDHYYNLDFPWGTYSSRPAKIPGEPRPLTHALGYGEDL